MKLRITIDNRVYEVEVEASEPEPHALPAVHLSAAPPPVAAPAPSASGSPVAGVVLKVLAEAGARVEKGQTLVVLEAMKMETNITAPRAGVIQKVLVKAGEAVQAGQPLFELED